MFALDKWEFLKQIFLWLSAFPVTNTHQFASKAIFSLESTFFHEQMETKADRLDLILKDPWKKQKTMMKDGVNWIDLQMKIRNQKLKQYLFYWP